MAMGELVNSESDDEALRLYEEIVDRELDDPRGALALALKGLELDTSPDVRALIAFHAANLSAVFREDERAFALWESVIEDEAIAEEFRLGAALQHVYLRLMRGQTLSEEDRALIFDDTLIERSGNPVFVHQVRAQYFVFNGAHDSAFHAASAAIALGGEDLELDPLQAVTIHAIRGFAAAALELSRELDEAIGVIEELLGIFPSLFIGQMVLRQLQYERGIRRNDPAAALKAMAEAEAIARANANIWYGYRLAQIELHMASGRLDEARALVDDEFLSADVPPRFRAMTAHSFGLADGDATQLERAFELYAQLHLDEYAIQVSGERVELLMKSHPQEANAANNTHLEYLFEALHRAPTERDRLRIQNSLLNAVGRTLSHFIRDDAEASLLLITRAKSACIQRIVLRRNDNPLDAHRDFEELDHRAVYDELTRVHPLSARPAGEPPLSLEELQRALPPTAAALEIYVGAGTLHLFLLTSDGLESANIPLDRELEQALIIILEGMNEPASTGLAALSFEAALGYSYDRLIAPWEEALQCRDLLLLSHGALFSGLPFAALLDRHDRFLIESVALAHISSFARILDIDFSPGVARSFRAVRGYDRADAAALKHADAELAEASALAARAGLAIKNSEPKKLIDYFDAELIHYAGHAIPGNEHLMDIALPLGPTRDLRAAELLAHDLRHVSLVILAACQTGGSLLFHGDEVGGFVRALSASGVKRALLARLPIDDAFTAEFLSRVYRYYFGGRTIEHALTDAIRELLDEARHANARLSAALFGNFLVQL